MRSGLERSSHEYLHRIATSTSAYMARTTRKVATMNLTLAPDDETLMANSVTDILNTLGVKQDEHTFDTPKRFVRYLQEFCQPFEPSEVLGSQFPSNGVTSMVVQGPIAFRGICAHHLCPMLGTAYFGYIPNKKVVGLSKIAR